MKKIIALTACVILLTSGLAIAAEITPGGGVTTTDGLSVYGGTDGTNSSTAATSTLIGKLSKGVNIGAYYTTTSYALTTKHSSGTTQYGTASDATAIYKQEGSALAAPSASTFTAFATWTAM